VGLGKKVISSVDWNKMKTFMLNSFAKHIGHQHQNGGKTFKQDGLKDE
jgi:hypothetical protein